MLKIIFVFFLITASSYAQDSITFKGHIQNSQFKSLNGRECSLDLRVVAPEGDQTIAYVARAHINGLNPIFNKRKAPKSVMYVNDLATSIDTNSSGKKNVLVGMGSKYRNELSQRLYVIFTETGTVSSWDYLDGTETQFGFTYSCN